MNPDTVNLLIALNHQFYQTFAAQFSATRTRLQPGVQRILTGIPTRASILDLGCGNGELYRALRLAGRQGLYVGLDFSADLLHIASDSARTDLVEDPNAVFLQADLSNESWHTALPATKFDYILAFASLHHLPSQQLHLRILAKIKDLLSHQGIFIHSAWQFLNSAKLKARIQPWEKVGLAAQDVEQNDYLLDWRRGGDGLRYVHHFSESELQSLANQSGFEIVETFLSDGEGGKLGLYQVWRVSS